MTSQRRSTYFLLLISLTFLQVSSGLAAEPTYFQIQVVDDVTGRGVPLVELETVNSIVHITDNAGNIAFFEPGLMDQQVFFQVRSHGYEFPKDGFGYRGARLQVTTGGKVTLKIKRVNLAERLYRITGAGGYRDTVLLGQPVPIKEPLLNSRVVGSDSVVNAILDGKLYWFWGDTLRPSYPLGNFQVPGATSRLPRDGGLDPAVGIDLKYFQDRDGFAKETAKMPGKGPTWIFGTGIVKSPEGQDELWTGYMKIEPPLKVYARGVARFNTKTEVFDQVVEFPAIPNLFPEGQTLTHRDGNVDYLYFCKPYPLVRVPATAAAYQDPSQYEAFTCLKPGCSKSQLEVERDAQGRALYAWKKNTAEVGPAEQHKLIATGQLKPAEAILRLRDRDTGKAITAHTGSVNWNEYRQRWVMVLVEHYGTSLLGEAWYAEADSPLGPWEYAVKVVSHNQYSFYNPKQHPYFDQQGGRLIYFEGTYTQSFSGNPLATPRYEYNQMLYRLDLGDPRTTLPVAVYQSDATSPFQTKIKDGLPRRESIQFYALDRPGPHSIPVYSTTSKDQSGPHLSTQQPTETATAAPVFYALPHDLSPAPSTTAELWEFRSMEGDRVEYSLGRNAKRPGYLRSDTPLCRVWKPR